MCENVFSTHFQFILISVFFVADSESEVRFLRSLLVFELKKLMY